MSSDLVDPGADELSRACRIDSTCDRFETAWKSGSQPVIEDYLGEIAAPERLVLTCELIILDVHYRRLAGQTCLVNEYDSRFPELDPTWLAAVIPGRTGGSSIPSASHPPNSVTNAVTIANSGKSAPPVTIGSLQSFGRYEIIAVLGKGGMGVVYQARDPQLSRDVALKVMRPDVAAKPDSSDRFLREARAMATFRHDHVVEIYEYGELDGVRFVTMPLLAGEHLTARLDRQGALPAAEVVRIGMELADGLAAVHEKGLIHRDLKPSNVWLEAPNGRVKLLDFGLARDCGANDRLTHIGTLVGTPAYMSPEQVNGPDVDARSDLFSLTFSGPIPSYFRSMGFSAPTRTLAPGPAA
jgi:hypothetical protein